MTDCEIVTSTALNKEFKYCRTHKREESECNPPVFIEATLASLSPLLPFGEIEKAKYIKEVQDAIDRARLTLTDHLKRWES